MTLELVSYLQKIENNVSFKNLKKNIMTLELVSYLQKIENNVSFKNFKIIY